MRVAVPLGFLFVLSVLCFLAHAAVVQKNAVFIINEQKVKAIEIIHMPRVMFAGSELGFQVRIRGARDEDRYAFAMLCEVGAACSLRELEHERISELPIEGSAAPKLWAPRPFTHMPPGEFILVAGLGAFGNIRVAESLTVSVQGM